MNALKNQLKAPRFFLFVFLTSLTNPAFSDVRLSRDWKVDYNAHPLFDESAPLELATIDYAKEFNAVDQSTPWGRPDRALAFQLYFGGAKYYIQPVQFMAKDHPDEVCTPERYTGQPNYSCHEGQHYKHSCHLFFFNSKYEPVGAYRIKINEPFEVFCNATPAIGVYDKTKNELLVTLQYFPIDRKAASRISEVGSNWIRMTSLFRLKEENGRISVEQDDVCLKNPNRYETIPDARKALRLCENPSARTKQ